MTDIVEEARAMLARLNEGAFAWGNAHANQQGERLLAALADECERLRAENALLREAMPSDAERQMAEAVMDELRHTAGGYRASDIIAPWLARLGAARKWVR